MFIFLMIFKFYNLVLQGLENLQLGEKIKIKISKLKKEEKEIATVYSSENEEGCPMS